MYLVRYKQVFYEAIKTNNMNTVKSCQLQFGRNLYLIQYYKSILKNL